ncbi:hypothetical protein [Corynebacterium glutamicum]|uniref:hypothetical protein n=1 Tax=Corynebacterium glutamicum TaxID=1718 RepID=UPI0007449413|nr:hypothetical protein [Corynebacterium glutamicum]AMA00225.1 hypothetical protein APT58_08300 [Corynebacterium glutamicum]
MRFLENPGSIPSWLRRVIWPLIWRLAVVFLPIGIGMKNLSPISPWGTAELQSMFYAVASVLGVLAAFLTTSLTILASSDSQATQRIRKEGGSGLVVTFLYAVITLLFAALTIALLGPIADVVRWSKFAMVGLVLVSVLEMLIITIYTYFALVEKGS